MFSNFRHILLFIHIYFLSHSSIINFQILYRVMLPNIQTSYLINYLVCTWWFLKNFSVCVCMCMWERKREREDEKEKERLLDSNISSIIENDN